jgi:transcriptional regulator with XRE-family HTH domain
MNRLRQVRKQRGLTLEELAKELQEKENLKIVPNGLGKYEREEREPRRETWIKLADYYDVPVAYLMGLPSGLVEYIDRLGNMTFESLQDAIIHWGYERSIVSPKNTPKQFMKVTEELGELAEGINKDNQGQIKDSLGDILVTLIILSKDLDVDLLDCLRGAYDVIKDRTGKTVNGVFVKEEDLHE